MTQTPARTLFTRDLAKALSQLYDPASLRHSPLIRLFRLDKRSDAMAALQRLLADAIDLLKPDTTVPPSANAWRLYHVLYYRFREGFTQIEIGKDLAVGERQVRRLEEAAIELLADRLWADYHLQSQADMSEGSAGHSSALERETDDAKMPDQAQELQWLEQTQARQPVNLSDTLQAILDTARPLLDELGVTVRSDVAETLPLLASPPVTLRQALLHTITTVARVSAGGFMGIAASLHADRATMAIEIAGQRHDRIPPAIIEQEPGIDLISQLVRISGGEFRFTSGADTPGRIAVQIVLPVVEHIPVLILDDNVDTLTLLGRYLTGTPYRFVGVSTPEEMFTLCQTAHPEAIVLDVMLPGMDGWEVLGRLRAHPDTRALPVIVCSILPEAPLALALGAAEFLQKPVSRPALLAALARQTGRRATGSPPAP